MYEIRIESLFHAQHALRLADGTLEPVHAHDWRVMVRVAARKLDGLETVMDFHQLQRITDGVIAPLAGKMLNDLEPFKIWNPSAERVAEYLYKQIAPQLPPNAHLVRVTVTEAPGCRASYIGEAG